MEFISLLFDWVLHLDVHLAQVIQEYGSGTYAILFGVIFCETGLVVLPFLPGDSLLFVAGALTAANPTTLNIGFLFGLLYIAAVAGDNTNYAIGRFVGLKLFTNPNSKIFRKDYLDRTHAFYEKYGGKTIILARFVPIVRTFAPFVAGLGKMTYPRFLSFELVGGALWIGSLTFAGYFFGNIAFIQKNLTIVIFSIIFLSILPAIIELMRGTRDRERGTGKEKAKERKEKP